MKEKEPKDIENWNLEMGHRMYVSKEIVLSTEGSLPPEPPFVPPNEFTDLDGITYTFQQSLPRRDNRQDFSHVYFIPGETQGMSRTHRIIREQYLKGVLERQEHERELEAEERKRLHERRAKKGILYENGYLTKDN